MDPVEMRLKNCNRPDETTPMGLKVTSCGLKECIQSVAEKLNQKKAPPRGARRRGSGMASLFHVGGGGRIYRSDACGLVMKLDDFANVYVYCGGVEMGQGLHAVLVAMVAEALGVPPSGVFINQTDTATCPWDVGTHASRGAFMAGNAVRMCADQLRKKIFSFARDSFASETRKNLKKHLRKNPDYQPPDFDLEAAASKGEFELADGLVFIPGAPDEPWLWLDLAQLLRAAHFRQGGQMLVAEAFYDPPTELPDWERGVGNMSAAYVFGTQGAEVEVDCETGEVKILKIALVHDVGRVLNPQTLRGQMIGALAQGIGYALYEEVVSDEGWIANPNFRDYKIPTVHEMDFEIDLGFIETMDAQGPFGAKGVGEPGMVPTAPAIANAIYDAIGVRIRDLPITPEKILAALRKRAG
jgi:xanthine dehydrogenase molybdenum-binding subunit